MSTEPQQSTSVNDQPLNESTDASWTLPASDKTPSQSGKSGWAKEFNLRGAKAAVSMFPHGHSSGEEDGDDPVGPHSEVKKFNRLWKKVKGAGQLELERQARLLAEQGVMHPLFTCDERGKELVVAFVQGKSCKDMDWWRTQLSQARELNDGMEEEYLGWIRELARKKE
ncbi:hypothetical protein BJY04DRAFT_216382 [Aspergillus karnatakaensis]|uniref:uncharacterized protein n=1 Tax=Aspergillus karnatakaensis TaxID=1810916 RepID=UPI003CCE1B68